MKIQHTIGGEETSAVTVNDQPAFTMGRDHSMLALLGNNSIQLGAHYGDDYYIRDSPNGNIIGRWFVERYGWKKFWPPGATLPRVERLMLTLYKRAVKAQDALDRVTKIVLADESLPRRKYKQNGTEQTEPVVCGLNRYNNEIEYAVHSKGYWIGSREHITNRSALGDQFAKAADHASDTWTKYNKFTHIMNDAVKARLLQDKKKIGIHAIIVNGNKYQFRLFEKYDRLFGSMSVEIESLDNHGTTGITETIV